MNFELTRPRAAVVTLALALLASGCGGGPEVLATMPDPLVGRWISSDASYSDAFVELTPTRVVIGAVDGTRRSYGLSRVLREELGAEIRYRVVYYGDDGVEYGLNFTARDDSNTRIRFQSRPGVVWSRVGETP